MVRSKFNVNTSKNSKEKRTLNGHEFSSDVEYRFYVYLLSKQEKGIVKSIKNTTQIFASGKIWEVW